MAKQFKFNLFAQAVSIGLVALGLGLAQAGPSGGQFSAAGEAATVGVDVFSTNGEWHELSADRFSTSGERYEGAVFPDADASAVAQDADLNQVLPSTAAGQQKGYAGPASEWYDDIEPYADLNQSMPPTAAGQEEENGQYDHGHLDPDTPVNPLY